MSLVFDTTDSVDCGTGANLDNLPNSTLIAWGYLTSAGGRLYQKGVGIDRHYMITDATNFVIDRFCGVGLGADEAFAALANFTSYGLNKWMFLAGTTDHVTAGNNRLLIGDLSTKATEPSAYGGQSIGTGSAGNNSGNAAVIGNGSVGGSNPWNGRLALLAVWNRTMSVAEIQSQQFRPRVTSGCVLFQVLGYNGTGTQPDWSGSSHAGTVNGAVVGDHVPIPFRRASSGLWLPTTPAAATAFPDHYYRMMRAA